MDPTNAPKSLLKFKNRKVQLAPNETLYTIETIYFTCMLKRMFRGHVSVELS